LNGKEQEICNFRDRCKTILSLVYSKTNSWSSRSTSASQQPVIEPITLPCLRDTGVTSELTLWYTAAKLRYAQNLTLYLKLMFPVLAVYCLR